MRNSNSRASQIHEDTKLLSGRTNATPAPSLPFVQRSKSSLESSSKTREKTKREQGDFLTTGFPGAANSRYSAMLESDTRDDGDCEVERIVVAKSTPHEFCTNPTISSDDLDFERSDVAVRARAQ